MVRRKQSRLCTRVRSGGYKREALVNNATTLTLIHNHPSGNPCPSRDDDRITATLKQACSTMRLYLIDHVVVTDSTYYSYSEEGKL